MKEAKKFKLVHDTELWPLGFDLGFKDVVLHNL